MAALGRATQALRASQAVGIPLSDPLVDNTPLGSFWVRVGVTVNTTNTTIPIQLPRTPSGFILFSTSAGAIVYEGSAGQAGWSGSQIIVRAYPTATVATLLIG